MYDNWIKAYESYNWVVDLTKYKEKDSFPEHFKTKIDIKNLHFLEKKFQNAINNAETNFDGRIVAGEVIFWKLNSKIDVNKKTSELINHLSYKSEDKAISIVWQKFAGSLISLSKESTVENFNAFCNFSNIPSGFTEPITLLAFYNPSEYPIADRIIAKWWQDNKNKFGYKESPNFKVNEGELISGSFYNREANWAAYLQWAAFCREYAKKLTELTNTEWNARKVEIAIWSAAGSNKIILEPLDKFEETSKGNSNNFSVDGKRKSPVLILFIDSYHKKRGGSPEYNTEKTLYNILNNPEKDLKIIETRKEVFSRLLNHEIYWNNCEQEIEEFNRNLIGGNDFGGQKSANYLPAIERYDGQFYTALGEEGKSEILKSNHHFLILSACYGLLLPEESVQLYACQFGQKNSAFYLWTKDRIITEILVEYIQKNEIQRILDFTYCDVISYHFSIDWEYLKEKTNVEVIHCYHALAEGDKALRDFGYFIKDNILTRKANELLEMETGIVDNIVLSSKIEVKDIDNSVDITVGNLIEIGECETIEFKKGAFRSANPDGYPGYVYDDDPNFIFEKNNSMFAIAKTIVAFLNTHGGTLLIGVEELKNEGDICKTHSITEEYSKLQDKNLDGYKRKIIDDIIDKMIYPKDIMTHFSKYLNISFEEVKGDTICRIHAKKSDIPFYAIAFYNNERQKAHFYKRTDSETREVYFQFTGDYILKHFCKIS